MIFDLEHLSVASIDKYINELKSKLLEVNEEIFTNYTLDNIKELPKDEIITILTKYSINIGYADYFEIISDISKNDLLKTTLPKNIAKIETILNNIIKEINTIIFKELNAIKKHNQEIEEEIKFYEKLKTYIEPSFTFSKEEYQELANLILNSNLEEQEKVNLTRTISKIIITSYKSKIKQEPVKDETKEYPLDDITTFDDQLEIVEIEESKSEDTELETKLEVSELKQKQIEYANNILNKYKMIFKNNNFSSNIEEISESFSLEEILDDIENSHMDIDNYLILIAILIYKIKDINITPEEAQKYVDLLINYDSIYDFNITETIKLREYYIHELEIFNKKVNDIYSILNRLNLTTDDTYNKLSDLRHEMNLIKEKIDNLDKSPFMEIDDIKKDIDNILSTIKYLHDNLIKSLGDKTESKSSQIKSFILFDIDKITGKPYIYNDILGKKETVEEQAIISSDASSYDINYQYTISKLIKDLMTYGTCEYMLSVISSSANKSEKVEQQVCQKEANGKVNRDKKTELWRIRPTPTSNIRFVDKKIVIPCGTELFYQVKEAIQKHLPKSKIADNEDFVIIVNIICGVKKTDETLYSEAIDRYERKESFPLSLFYENGNYKKSSRKPVQLKKKLSEEDLKKLDELIKSSLQLFSEMSKQDSNYNFDFINDMSGDKKYGI